MGEKEGGSWGVSRGTRVALLSAPRFPYTLKFWHLLLSRLRLVQRWNVFFHSCLSYKENSRCAWQWYGINYAWAQIAHWDFQNKGTLTSAARLFFASEVPPRNLPPSIVYSVPRDRIVQRAYWCLCWLLHRADQTQSCPNSCQRMQFSAFNFESHSVVELRWFDTGFFLDKT